MEPEAQRLPQVPPPRSSSAPKPDLMASLIILLLSAAINIFVFWISSQYLGKENFQRLPDWIIGTYKGIWSSAVVGSAGIGLAIVRAVSKRNEPSPHYLLYIGITSAAMLVPASVLIAIPFLVPSLRGHVIDIPSGSARVVPTDHSVKEFDLENPVNWSPVVYVSYVLKGTYSVTGTTLKGHLAQGKFTLAKEIPRNFPDNVTRISFRVCYLHSVNGSDQMDAYPDNPKSRDSLDVNLPLIAGASYDLPEGNFSFDLPSDRRLDRAWLCAGLYNGSGYFPAQ